jgi:hypothetical protein
MNAFPHLRNVQISAFENNTSEYALAQDIQNHLVNSFQSDGRLRISNINPDSVIDGTVLDYRHEILDHDIAGNILGYRVSILFSIEMHDLRQQQVMYENKSLLISANYTPNTTNPDLLATEEQAQRRIFERLFEIVIDNTLEKW